MTSRGIRNHNPGNIRKGDLWQGRAPEQADPDFVQFETMAWGIRALVMLLRKYRIKYGLTTIRGVISRWAPPNENDTDAYVHAVSAGWKEPDAFLPDDRETYLRLAQGIARHENGKDAEQITQEEWDAGMTLAGFPNPGDTIPESIPEPAPIREAVPPILPPTKPMAPFALFAFEALSNLLPTLIRMKSSGPQGEANAKLAEKVIPIVQNAVGAANAQEAVEKITNDPGVLAVADKAVRDQFFDLMEVGGGVSAAREFNVLAGNTPLWKQPAMVVSILLLPLVYYVVAVVLQFGDFSQETKSMVVQAIIVGVLSGITGFFLGSSVSSRAKDEALARK